MLMNSNSRLAGKRKSPDKKNSENEEIQMIIKKLRKLGKNEVSSSGKIICQPQDNNNSFEIEFMFF